MSSTASAVSIFATRPTCPPPCARRNARISRTASALRTKEAATKSTSCSMPKRMSARSWSVMTGSGTVTPGTLTDLRSPSTASLTTRQAMSAPSTASTASSMRPSSTSSCVPGRTCSDKPAHVWVTRSALPATSRSVSTIPSPARSATGRPPASLPVLISGPRMSKRIAQGDPVRAHARRTRAMRSACSACVPCEKLSRATSMPASRRRESTPSSSVAGPRVQMIFVRFAMSSLRSRLRKASAHCTRPTRARRGAAAQSPPDPDAGGAHPQR